MLHIWIGRSTRNSTQFQFQSFCPDVQHMNKGEKSDGFEADLEGI